MNNRTTSDTSAQSATTEAFRHAAFEGRHSLNPSELAALLSDLAVDLRDGGAAGGAYAPVELHFSLTATREFGMVLSAGLGGLDAELDPAGFRKDRAVVHAITELTDASGFLSRFRRTLAYQKLARIAQHAGTPSPDALLHACFERLIALGNQYAPGNPDTDFVLRTFMLDRVRVGEGLSTAAAHCTFGAPEAGRLARPIHKIDKLIHPKSIGIIGVSASSMNFGRIILRNLMGSGYPKERIAIIRAGETEIDGVHCVESLRALEDKLDLLIVAVAADAVYALVDEIIETDAVEAVMLIPGSLGETRKSKEPAEALAARINAAHGKAGGGPIFLGANCLGVVSHPGNYDSWFIPLERLPKPQKKPERNSVLLSQSGAFMITRLSQNPWLDPRYMIAMGNQTDLTHGDLLTYFADQSEIETIGVYAEGFKDLDGLAFARAVRRAVVNGKQVVVYKSGRTIPGAAGVMGHTASIAGDPVVFESVLRQAGAIVTEDFNTFDDLFYIAGALHHKKIGGRRLGAISGAGFEAVGVADSVDTDTFSMEMGGLDAATVHRVEEVLAGKRLAALVEVRNPIDINPGADDEAHLLIVEAFAADPNIDAVVVGLDPTAPSVRALEQSKLRPGYDITDPESTVHRMPELVDRIDKPVIGIIDGGSLYDAMAARLMDRGVCIFRTSSRGTRALVRYVEARLEAEAIRQQALRS